MSWMKCNTRRETGNLNYHDLKHKGDLLAVFKLRNMEYKSTLLYCITEGFSWIFVTCSFVQCPNHVALDTTLNAVWQIVKEPQIHTVYLDRKIET